jgi:hypothetical protein
VGNLRGDPGQSLSINLITGIWSDFSTGEKGSNLLELWRQVRGLRRTLPRGSSDSFPLDESPCTARRREADATLHRQPKEYAEELSMRVKSKRTKKPAPAPVVQVGAARALERLEAEEAALFTTYATAKAGGDVLEIKVARDAWLKCSESLRKFDLLVEAARREAGETLPRADVERWLNNFGCVLNMSLARATDSRAQTWEVLQSSFLAFIHDFNPKKSAPCCDVPRMFFTAFFESRAGGGAPELWKSFRRNAAFVDACKAYPGDHLKIESFLKAEFEKIESEKAPTHPAHEKNET